MSAWVPPEGAWAVLPKDVAVLDIAAQEPFKPLLNSNSPLLRSFVKGDTSFKASSPGHMGGNGNANDGNKTDVVLQLDFNTAHEIMSVPVESRRAAYGKRTAAVVNGNSDRGPGSCVVDAVTFAGGAVWCADFCPPPRGVPLGAFASVPSSLTSSDTTTSTPAAAPQGAPKLSATTAAPVADGGTGAIPVSRGAGLPNPASLGPASVEYVAVGAHPPGGGTNLTNVALKGPGAVQLWALPHGAAAPACPQGLPRCAMLLVHEGRVAWDVRWCKSPGCIFQQQHRQQQYSSDTQRDHREPQAAAEVESRGEAAEAVTGGAAPSLPVVGLLAVVLGNGSVVVTAVPEPMALEAGDFGRGCGGAADGVKAAADAQTEDEGIAATTVATVCCSNNAAAATNNSDGLTAMDGIEGPNRACIMDEAGMGQGLGTSVCNPQGAAGPAPCPGPTVEAATPGGEERVPLRGKSPGPPTPLVRLVRPAVLIRREQMCGALASCCDWHMPDPRVGPPQLLVGCWDGSVALWRLPRGGSAGLVERTQLLFHILADVLPLRRVISNPIWDTDFLLPVETERTSPQAAEADGGMHSRSSAATATATATATAAAALGCGLGGRTGAPGGPAGHLFCTTGYTGRVKIWDDRDTSRPLLDRIVHRSYVNDTAWTRRPAALALAQDDGGLRVVLLDAAAAMSGGESSGGVGSLTFREPNCSALWSAYYVPRLHMLLYGGTEGVVAAVAWEFPADTRNRRPHVPLAGLVRDGPYMRLLSPSDVRGIQLFYPGGYNWRGSEGSTVPRPGIIVPDPEQQLYVVRAGYGLPPPPRFLQLQQPSQSATAAADEIGVAGGGRGRWRGDGSAGGACVSGGGGSGALRGGSISRRGRASMGAASGSMMSVDGVAWGPDGATVWVLMGWRCGVLRFMRLSPGG